ncbi:MAG TPA: 2-phospho-L-lactate transferase CofD family protein, partial [bacterium]|nr:2-phospho-L-lactate transferase CofD family protein [bacterium]
LPFQDYFVLRGARDPVTAIEFEGLDRARPSPEAVEAVGSARLIIVAPSNPLVSIRPILALPGMEAALARSAALRVAVTPLIRGAAIKGPTVEMLRGLGMDAAPDAVAALYRTFLDVFVLDIRDRALAGSVARAGSPGRPLEVECTDTLMLDETGRRRLARDLLAIAQTRGVEIACRP